MATTKILLKSRLILEEHGRLLLLKQRKANGGNYTLVGGTVENYEMARQSLIRESEEEAGIILEERNLELVHTLHKKKNKLTRIVLYFRPTAWDGVVQARETKKFKEVDWFPVDQLPGNMTETVRHVLEQYRKGRRYSELVL